MYEVIFEVRPDPNSWDTYLTIAKGLKPQLEAIEGFIENVRYKSLTREGWLLSLSDWADEKALTRWRTRENHHSAQQKGRDGVLSDYHLRVGEVSQDSSSETKPRRDDLTAVGAGQYVTLHQMSQTQDWVQNTKPEIIAETLGFPISSPGLLEWDVLDAILTPGDVILIGTWKDEADAAPFLKAASDASKARTRTVRIVRDYGKYDRREAPQFYHDAKGAETIHA